MAKTPIPGGVIVCLGVASLSMAHLLFVAMLTYWQGESAKPLALARGPALVLYAALYFANPPNIAAARMQWKLAPEHRRLLVLALIFSTIYVLSPFLAFFADGLIRDFIRRVTALAG